MHIHMNGIASIICSVAGAYQLVIGKPEFGVQLITLSVLFGICNSLICIRTAIVEK